MRKGLTATDITTLLALRHERDVFVPECLTGSTHRGYQRLDAWAMRKSYARAMTWGYEIKIGRSDWLKDEKWHGYLPVCNAFYFVCPSGLIPRDEVPADAGLLWVASTGTRLLTKKKAPTRDVHLTGDFWRSLVINRLRVDRPYQRPCTREDWEAWLARRKNDQNFGHMLSGTLATTVREQVIKAQAELRQVRRENEALADVKKFCAQHRIPTEGTAWDSERRIKNLLCAVPVDLQKEVARLQHSLSRFTKRLEKLELDPKASGGTG